MVNCPGGLGKRGSSHLYPVACSPFFGPRLGVAGYVSAASAAGVWVAS